MPATTPSSSNPILQNCLRQASAAYRSLTIKKICEICEICVRFFCISEFLNFYYVSEFLYFCISVFLYF